MKTVVLSIQPLDTALAAFSDAWKGGSPEDAAHIGFANWALMHKVLSPKRMEILAAMVGAGPLSIREIARRVGRDFKGVHSDVSLLSDCGVVVRNGEGRIEFPFDRVRVDFQIPAAA